MVGLQDRDGFLAPKLLSPDGGESPLVLHSLFALPKAGARQFGRKSSNPM